MPERRALEPPGDLTIPVPGSTTARDILSRDIGLMLQELRPLVRAHAALAPAADVAAFGRVVAAVQKAQVGALASVLRLPNVGALLRTLRRAPEEGDRALLCELMSLTCFELAVKGALPFEVTLARFPRRILSMAAEVAFDVPEDVQSVALTAGRMRMSRGGGASLDVDLDRLNQDGAGALAVRRPFHSIDGGTRLALEDNNPLAHFEAHPDKLGNAVDLGGATVEMWTTSLRKAFELVATYLPALRAEMELYVSQVVPVGVDPHQHLSASYREAIGTLYMTLHPSPMTMVEALIHEFSHNKLNALFELDDVLDNAFSPLYASPVRPDPRPLHGVLLAVHAFLPVGQLYEQMVARAHPLAEQESFRERLLAIMKVNREGAAVVLEHGRPTTVGAGLLGEIRRLLPAPIAAREPDALDSA